MFQGDAKGQPLTVALAGDGGLEPGRADLRLTRLAGSLGGDRLFLEQPLTLSRRGADLAFSGLALDFGAGRITGSGGVRGESLSLALNAANLPIASAAASPGYRNVRGTLNAAATLGGTLRAPQGRISLNARELTVASSRHSRLTSLGLAVDGNWNGRNLDVKGQVTGLKGDRVALTGSVPLLLTPAPLGISVPPDGRLALQLQGAGQIEHLADLLPLGEDRVSGHFAADVTVGGTVARLRRDGRLKLSDARYENFATGAVLNNMQADLVGDRDRFTLDLVLGGGQCERKPEGAGQCRVERPLRPDRRTLRDARQFPGRRARRGGRHGERNGRDRRSADRAQGHRAAHHRSRRHQPAGQPAAQCGRAEGRRNQRQDGGKPPPPATRPSNRRRSRRRSTSPSTCPATSLCAGMGWRANGAAA